eukprot:6200965-Pleurochrysis_carterae.AAC.3
MRSCVCARVHLSVRVPARECVRDLSAAAAAACDELPRACQTFRRRSPRDMRRHQGRGRLQISSKLQARNTRESVKISFPESASK